MNDKTFELKADQPDFLNFPLYGPYVRFEDPLVVSLIMKVKLHVLFIFKRLQTNVKRK